jgi:DNA-directed RNA polymerase specialized sigma24 family protein
MQTHASPTPAVGAVRAALGTQREQLLALVRRRGGKKVDAEDVLHTALQRAIERAEQLRDPALAEAWVARVVRNVLIDELRKRREPEWVAEQQPLATPEDGGIGCRCVWVQAQRLKPQYSSLLRRVIIDGVAVKQVAAELGLTPNNAMVRLHRARRALKQQLESHCGTTTARACYDCGCEERRCCPAD